jgi:predicted MFS family arabinose efflux permease
MAPVGALRRLAHLIWGAEVDRALRPVLAIALVATIAGSTLWSFIGIWAIDELDAEPGQLGIAFLVAAFFAGILGYVGGHLSDHLGRRRMILIGQAAFACYVLGYPFLGNNVLVGLGYLTLAGAVASIGGSVTQALVADLVPKEKHEEAYAAQRVASNLGVTLGPPLGGLFLLLGGWRTLFVGASILAWVAFAIGYRLVPSRGRYTPEAPPERGSGRVILRDYAFLLFLGSAMFAWLVYVSFEVVLPVSLVDTYGFSPALWGFLVIVNPLTVTLFQLRLTRRVEHIPAAPKLVVAMLMMGLPFLLLSVKATVPVVLFVITVFVVGEMLWVPTSQSIVAGLAPADLRGAYMGAFGSTAAVGFALAPFFGLQTGERYGDTAMWGLFAGLAVVGAVLGAIATRGASRAVRPSAVLDA